MRSANDVTRGGTETKMRESARASAVPKLCRLPVMMPSGHTDECGEEQSRGTEQRRLPCAFGHELADRPAVLHRLPEIEPHGAAQPGAVACEERAIESEAVTLGRGDSRIEVERVDRIAGGSLDQHQRRRRDDEHEQHREEQATKQVAACLTIWRPPACPRSRAGVARAEPASG